MCYTICIIFTSHNALKNFRRAFTFCHYFELLIRYRPFIVIDIKELFWYQKSAARTGDKVETESPPSRAGLDKIFSTATLRRDVLSVPTSTSLHPPLILFRFHLWNDTATIVCSPASAMSIVTEKRERRERTKEAGERVDVCARISVRELEPNCYGGIRLRKRKKQGDG